MLASTSPRRRRHHHGVGDGSKNKKMCLSQQHAPCSQHDLNPNPRTQGLSPRVSTSSSWLRGRFIVPGMRWEPPMILLVRRRSVVVALICMRHCKQHPRLASQPTHAHNLNTQKHRAQQQGVQHEQACVLKRRNLLHRLWTTPVPPCFILATIL
jgi:hypothetical protein